MSFASDHSETGTVRVGTPDTGAWSPDEIQFLVHPEGAPVGKAYVGDTDAARGYKSENKQKGAKWFVPAKASIRSLEDLTAAVAWANSRADVAAVQGKPSRHICRDGVINGEDGSGHLRTTLADPSRNGFTGNIASAARSYIYFDLDETPLPATELDGDLDALAARLPDLMGEPFSSASAVVRFSNSCGLPDKHCVRAQVWLLVDEPVSEDKLKRACNAINARAAEEHGIAKMVDPSVAHPSQKRYIGAPVFRDFPDPFEGRDRVRVVHGSRQRVKASDMPSLDPSKARQKTKGRGKGKASKGAKKPSAPLPAKVRSVLEYTPDPSRLPSEHLCEGGGHWGDVARSIEDLACLRFGGVVESGWRDLFCFWFAVAATCAEGNVPGSRALEIGEVFRARYAPSMEPREMRVFLGALEQRADEDAEAASRSRNGCLKRESVRKYTPSNAKLADVLMVSRAEMELLPELRTAAARKAESRKASATESTTTTSKPIRTPHREMLSASTTKPNIRKEGTMSALSKMKAAAANDVDTDAEPTVPAHKAERKPTSGLSAMKRPQGRRITENPPLIREEPREQHFDLLEFLTSEETAHDPTPSARTPCAYALARHLWPEATSADVRDLESKKDSTSRCLLHQAYESYAAWRRREIERLGLTEAA